MDETPTERARKLRRDATKAERALWERIGVRRILGAKFRRQHTIGNYFPDFCCIEDRLVIEIDGDTHLDRDIQEKDGTRTEILAEQGYKVIRFSDSEVMLDIDRVLSEIAKTLAAQRAGREENLRPRAKRRARH